MICMSHFLKKNVFLIKCRRQPGGSYPCLWSRNSHDSHCQYGFRQEEHSYKPSASTHNSKFLIARVNGISPFFITYSLIINIVLGTFFKAWFCNIFRFVLKETSVLFESCHTKTYPLQLDFLLISSEAVFQLDVVCLFCFLFFAVDVCFVFFLRWGWGLWSSLGLWYLVRFWGSILIWNGIVSGFSW